MAVLYLCDQQGCTKARELGHCPDGTGQCVHTSDVNHALDFIKDPNGNLWQMITSRSADYRKIKEAE